MTKEAIRKYLPDSTPLRIRFEALAERKQGATEGEVRNPLGLNGTPELRINPNTVRVNPIDSEDDPTIEDPKPRDRSREPKAGNSIGYSVRRFERKAAEDPAVAAVYERLKAGEITADRASVLVGFKPDTIPTDPAAAVIWWET